MTRMLSRLWNVVLYGIKFIYYALFLSIIGYFLWKYRDQVLPAWRKFCADVRAFWESLFSRPPDDVVANDSERAASTPPLPAFSSFTNPFRNNMHERLELRELLQYTLAAMEAWGRENGCERQPDQTVLEFSREIGTVAPSLMQTAKELAILYDALAFSPSAAPAESARYLQRIWGTLEKLPPQNAAVFTA